MSLSFSSAFGSFEIAAQGASLRSLELAGHQLLHDFQDSAAEWAAGSLMFPFPVRMSTGTVMNFEGEQYHWPINDSKHHAALHGFTTQRKFSLEHMSNGIKATLNYDGSLSHYPFPCELHVNYFFEGPGHFSMEFTVENLGKRPLPYHVGWHPYFRLGEQPKLEPSPTHRLLKNKFSHPTKKDVVEGFEWSEEVDGAFYMDELIVHTPQYSAHIEPLCSITQIFRPEGAPFVAVEPITGLGHPDFPWKKLAAGELQRFKSTIRL